MNEAQMLVRVLQHLEANDRKIDELQRHLHAQMPVPMPQRNGELHESSNAGYDVYVGVDAVSVLCVYACVHVICVRLCVRHVCVWPCQVHTCVCLSSCVRAHTRACRLRRRCLP
jgi:hypothetical protein